MENFGIMIELRNGQQTLVLTDTEQGQAKLAEIHRSGRVAEKLTGLIARLADGRWYLTPFGKGSQWFVDLDQATRYVHGL